MGLRYLLDSNILSEPTKAAPNVLLMQRLQQHDGQFATAATVWHELHFGVARMEDSARKTRLQGYLALLQQAGLQVLPYDRAAAEWLAQARAGLMRRGLTPAYADGEIAAIAASQGLVLVTRNVADFAHFDGLQVENWFE